MKKNHRKLMEEQKKPLPEQEKQLVVASDAVFEKPKGKEWKYVGPADNHAEIRIPGDPERYHPADLPQRHIEFYIASTPGAEAWWK